MEKIKSAPQTASAVILAAGASSRMGRPKQLLEIQGKSLVALAVEAFCLSGIEEVIVVTGCWRKEVEAEVKRYRVKSVPNKEPGPDMMESVRIGVGQVSDKSGACLILPVDCALVSADTIKGLLRLHWQFPQAIIRPFSGRRGGHPLLIPRRYFHEVFRIQSLRHLLKELSGEVIDMQSKDIGAFFDIDTPQDYERALRLYR